MQMPDSEQFFCLTIYDTFILFLLSATSRHSYEKDIAIWGTVRIQQLLKFLSRV